MSSPTDLTPEQVRELWCERLEDPKSKQAFGELRAGSGRCCLGHLADLAVEHGIIADYVGATLSGHKLAPVREWVGLATHQGGYGNGRVHALSSDNDNGDALRVIAATIRRKPPGLFVDDTEGETR